MPPDDAARPLREFDDAAGMLASAGRFPEALAEALQRMAPVVTVDARDAQLAAWAALTVRRPRS